LGLHNIQDDVVGDAIEKPKHATHARARNVSVYTSETVHQHPNVGLYLRSRIGTNYAF
jgi:hypothetical protein